MTQTRHKTAFKTNRSKTIAAAIGVIFLTLIALTVLVWGMTADRAVLGGIGFVVVFGAGFALMTFMLNRWRPPVPSDDS